MNDVKNNAHCIPSVPVINAHTTLVLQTVLDLYLLRTGRVGLDALANK